MAQQTSDHPKPSKGGLFRTPRPIVPVAPIVSTRHTKYAADGRITDAPEGTSITDAMEFVHDGEHRIALHLFPSPNADDIEELANAWGLHPLLVEDLQRGGQRPKLERYGEVLFAVVRSARYIDETEDVDFAEFHVLVRPHAIAVLCHDEQWITASSFGGLAERAFATLLREDEHGRDSLLTLGPEAVLYRFLDAIVDGYVPVLRGVAIDKEQIERQVFSGDAAVAERIYRLSQEVIDLQHAADSLSEVLDALTRGFDRYRIPEPLRAYLQDVSDHLTRVETRVMELREAFTQILSVNATLVAQRQNEDMKKISGWAAILFAPTLIGAIYGMNFDLMPELHWRFGYPLAVGAMVGLAAALYIIFKRKKWM